MRSIRSIVINVRGWVLGEGIILAPESWGYLERRFFSCWYCAPDKAA